MLLCVAPIHDDLTYSLFQVLFIDSSGTCLSGPLSSGGRASTIGDEKNGYRFEKDLPRSASDANGSEISTE